MYFEQNLKADLMFTKRNKRFAVKIVFFEESWRPKRF